MEVQVSLAMAFLAGLVSFLSPCVLPVVPSYLVFVSGLTLNELTDYSTYEVRIMAILHSVLFMFGFGLVFMTMGLVATTVGVAVAQALPWLSRAGGILMILLGLILMGFLSLPHLAGNLRLNPVARPASLFGSLAVGVAFGAGWTPCIGPILGAVLLYVSLESTMMEGMLLLGTYAFGLGIPFVAASVGLNWFIVGSRKVQAWIMPLQGLAGTVLVVIGLAMVTGQFARLTAFLAGLGQLINLEIS